MNQTRFAIMLAAAVAAVGGLMALMPEFVRHSWEPFGPGSNFWRNIQSYGVVFGCLGLLLLVMSLYYRAEFEHPPAYRDMPGETHPV